MNAHELVEKLRQPVMLHSSPEQTNAERRQAADFIERQAKHIDELQAKVTCMCGSEIDHSPWEGHSPVSMFDYAVEKEVERRLLSSQMRPEDK